MAVSIMKPSCCWSTINIHWGNVNVFIHCKNHLSLISWGTELKWWWRPDLTKPNVMPCQLLGPPIHDHAYVYIYFFSLFIYLLIDLLIYLFIFCKYMYIYMCVCACMHIYIYICTECNNAVMRNNVSTYISMHVCAYHVYLLLVLWHDICINIMPSGWFIVTHHPEMSWFLA